MKKRWREPNKAHRKNKIKFASVVGALIGTSVLLLLSALRVIAWGELFIRPLFSFLGVLFPLLISAFVSLRDSMPWEVELSSLIKRKEISLNKNEREEKSFIRVCYAAAVIIEVDDQFLLPLNPDGLGLYQLPARTYRLSGGEEVEIERQFEARRDMYIPHDYYDYRFKVPVRKLKPLYRHFCENIEPEQYSYQGIIDDMTAICGLEAKDFANADVKFRKRFPPKIQYSRFTKHYEMNVMDVCVLYPTEAQKKALRALMSENTEKFRFATLEEIEANGTNKAKGKLFADIMTTTYDFIVQ